MFVNIRMPMGKTLQSALLVPDRALQEDQGGRYLLVLDQNNVIRQRYVQLGELIGASAGHHERHRIRMTASSRANSGVRRPAQSGAATHRPTAGRGSHR